MPTQCSICNINIHRAFSFATKATDDNIVDDVLSTLPELCTTCYRTFQGRLKYEMQDASPATVRNLERIRQIFLKYNPAPAPARQYETATINTQGMETR